MATTKDYLRAALAIFIGVVATLINPDTWVMVAAIGLAIITMPCWGPIVLFIALVLWLFKIPVTKEMEKQR